MENLSQHRAIASRQTEFLLSRQYQLRHVIHERTRSRKFIVASCGHRSQNLLQSVTVSGAQKSLEYRTFVIGTAIRHNCYFIWNNLHWFSSFIRSDSMRLNASKPSLKLFFISVHVPLVEPNDFLSLKLPINSFPPIVQIHIPFTKHLSSKNLRHLPELC